MEIQVQNKKEEVKKEEVKEIKEIKEIQEKANSIITLYKKVKEQS